MGLRPGFASGAGTVFAGRRRALPRAACGAGMTPTTLDDDLRQRRGSASPEVPPPRPGWHRTPAFATRARHAPPRVLVMCGASVSGGRGDACGFQLARLAQEALDAVGVEADELDLGAVAAAYARSLHLCEHCLAHGADAEEGERDALDVPADWTADLRQRFATVDALLLIAPVRGRELPIGLQPLFDGLAAADGAAAILGWPVERPCGLLLQGDTGEVGQMLSVPLARLGFSAPLHPLVPERGSDLRELVRSTARALARAVAERRAGTAWCGAIAPPWTHPSAQP